MSRTQLEQTWFRVQTQSNLGRPGDTPHVG